MGTILLPARNRADRYWLRTTGTTPCRPIPAVKRFFSLPNVIATIAMPVIGIAVSPVRAWDTDTSDRSGKDIIDCQDEDVEHVAAEDIGHRHVHRAYLQCGNGYDQFGQRRCHGNEDRSDKRLPQPRSRGQPVAHEQEPRGCSDDKTSPTAMSGTPAKATELRPLISSGSDVTPAIRTSQIHARPSPVFAAITSPYRVKFVPQYTIIPEHTMNSTHRTAVVTSPPRRRSPDERPP